ncbi:hypothetical protein C1645_802854 [Glomus cerebriforme]|uniref:Uncharacterized protein n=1 Tax=Glomus cerebriforme TaxID=658196 RepID=A0A397TH51_9GLOM|nr:hypothetical protein C1645_802854 [Glomus cerebriforme]
MSYVGFKYMSVYIFIALAIFITVNFAHPTYDLENPISRIPRKRQETVKDPKKPKEPPSPPPTQDSGHPLGDTGGPPGGAPPPAGGPPPSAGGPPGGEPPPPAGGPPGGAPPPPAGVGENFIETHDCSDGTMNKRQGMVKCGRWF